jgi:hypothetical protein
LASELCQTVGGEFFFTWHTFLEVVKTQDLPSKIWQTLEDALRFYCDQTLGCNISWLPRTNVLQYKSIVTPKLRGDMVILLRIVIHCFKMLLQHISVVAIDGMVMKRTSLRGNIHILQ